MAKCHAGVAAVAAEENVKEAAAETQPQSLAGGGHGDTVRVTEPEHDTASSFFHSLQLHATKHQPGPAASTEETRDTRDKLESDLSFIESIGLYWVNPADRAEVREAADTRAEDKSQQQEDELRQTEADIDEFDFLSVLGLTPVTSGRRWRLWNPDIDPEAASCWDEAGLLCGDLGLAAEQETDPTVVEHLGARQQDAEPPPEITAQSPPFEPLDLNVNSRPKRNIKRSKLFDPDQEVVTKKAKLTTAAAREACPAPTITQAPDETGTGAEGPGTGRGRLVQCATCSARVWPHQYGKHLVSHYHYHRSLGHADAETLVLDNIRDIVHQSPFQCHVCRFYCNWHADFVAHVRSHGEEEPLREATFWCQVCMKVVRGHRQLMLHLHSFAHTELVTVINRSVPVIVRRIDLVNCQLCDKTFRFNVSLKKHMHQTHGLVDFELDNHEKFPCSYCNFSTYKKNSLKAHLFLAHRNPKLKYDCYICKQQFANKDTAVAHRNTINHKLNSQLHQISEDDPSCPQCSETFSDSEDLTKHLEQSHFPDLPQCHLCGLVFHFQQELALHLRLQCGTSSRVVTSAADTTAASHTCAHCPFSSRRPAVVSLHTKVRHTAGTDPLAPANRGMYYCQTCGHLFHSGAKFRKHQERCRAEYRCKLCHYTSSRKILLNLHVKRQHRNSSTDKDFECEVCGSLFKLETSLHNHMKQKHQEQKSQYICNYCDQTFLFKSDLARHEVTHANVKPFSCMDCSFVCKRKSELSRHRRIVHEDTPYMSCSLCGYQTRSADHLKRHTHTQHPVTEVTCFEIKLDEVDSDYLVTAIPAPGTVPEFVTEQIVINN